MKHRFIHCVKTVQMRSYFCSVFSCIRTEHRDLLRKFPYSVRIQENANQKLRILTFFTQWSLVLWGEQTWFYFWRYSAVVYHKFSHVNSWVFILDFTWNCFRLQEAKKFSRNSGHFKCVTKEIRCHVSIAELLIRNL